MILSIIKFVLAFVAVVGGLAMLYAAQTCNLLLAWLASKVTFLGVFACLVLEELLGGGKR